MSEMLKQKKVEKMLRMSAEELKEFFPTTLDELRNYGTIKLLEEIPDLLWRIIAKLIEIDAAKFLNEIPKGSDKFMGFLWETVGLLTEKSEEMKSVLEGTKEMNVNLEASDSPLNSHFTVGRGKLSGASGLLLFVDQDYRYLGPTEVLLRFLTGELTLGSSNPKLLTEGNPGLLPSLAPVMQGVSKLIRGEWKMHQ